MNPAIPPLAFFAFCLVVVLLAAGAQRALNRKYRRLIEHHLRASGHRLLTCRYNHWFNTRSTHRMYAIRYQDVAGRIYQAEAQTGPHHHVLLRNAQISPSGATPPPLPTHEQIRLLELENKALRQEIIRLSGTPPQ